MRVIVNEWITEPIPLSRGVRQGDSLSPMLYILCVEALACQIRSCSQIEGFLLPGANGSQYKVGIYADDTTNLVKSVSSLAALFRVINVTVREGIRSETQCIQNRGHVAGREALSS